MSRRRRHAAVVTVMLLLAGRLPAGEIDPTLEDLAVQAGPGESISALLILGAQFALPNLIRQLGAVGVGLRTRHQAVVLGRQAQARATQTNLRAALKALDD